MPWVASKHTPQCKCCTAPAAPMLNDLLERRKNRERDEDGNLITFKSIQESGLVECSMASLKRHVDHIEFVTADEAAAAHAADELEQESWESLITRTLGEEWQHRDVEPDDILRLQRAMYPRSILADVRAGRPVRVSHEQVQRAIAETTKRHVDDQRTELIKAMSGALTSRRLPELEQQTPVDVEYEIVKSDEITGGGFPEDDQRLNGGAISDDAAV